MIFGGIPYYMDMLDSRLSLSQNIDELLFKPKGLLAHEFSNLYAALFKNSDDFIKVVEALSKKKCGMSRTEIIEATSIPSGKGLTTILQHLEWCGFIRKYKNYKALRKENTLYQLVDFFTLFHFSFLSEKKFNSWSALQGTPVFYIWAGLTFELLALNHIDQIKSKLSIKGVNTIEYAWRSSGLEHGAQIDLVIDRADNVVDLCEMKCTDEPYRVTAQDISDFKRRREAYREVTRTRKSLHLLLVTLNGSEPSMFRNEINAEVVLDSLFAQ